MDSGDIEYVEIVFGADSSGARHASLIIPASDLVKFLRNPITRNVVDSWLKSRLRQEQEVGA